jgi:hypothetical protein
MTSPVGRYGSSTAGSTATGADARGLVETREDGDLHRDTRVDVLPADGMQEVWGSNPHSSTQVRALNRKPERAALGAGGLSLQRGPGASSRRARAT